MRATTTCCRCHRSAVYGISTPVATLTLCRRHAEQLADRLREEGGMVVVDGIPIAVATPAGLAVGGAR